MIDRIESMQSEMRRSFATVDQRFTAVHEQFVGVHARLDAVNEQFVGVNEQFAGVHARLDATNANVVAAEQRLAGVVAEEAGKLRVAFADAVAQMAQGQARAGGPHRPPRVRQAHDAPEHRDRGGRGRGVGDQHAGARAPLTPI